MGKRYLKSVLLMELCCIAHIFHPVLYVLSRKGTSGTAELIHRYVPFSNIHSYLIKFIDLIPEWMYSPAGIGIYYGVVIILFFLSYWSAFNVLKKRDMSLRFFFLSTLIFCFTLFFYLPGKHIDLFLYIFQGKMVYYYHANPYFVKPAVFVGDHLLHFVGWKDFTSAYGPVWHIVAAFLYCIGRDNIFLEIGVFKVFIIICHIVNVCLIYNILKIKKPEFKTIGTFLYAWNPLALIYSSCGNNNDFLMITFLLVGIYLYLKKEVFLPAVCFALSSFTKFSYAFFFPFYIKTLKTKKEILLSIIIFLFTSVLVWLPFYEGPTSLLKPFWMTGATGHSIMFLWNVVLSFAFSQNIAVAGTKFLQFILYILFLYIYISLFLKTHSFHDMLNSCAIIFFILVSLIMPNWATWYVMWCIPFAVLSGTPNIIFTCISFSFSALFALIIYFFFHSYAPVYQFLTFLLAIPLPLFIAVKTKIWQWSKNETISNNACLQ
ncbi:MAG: hypothetical protein PHI44_04025 [Candidatus Ratteibacteria bacterium]|nr:hypothetical protein [Candidatus Ratteibacteria bacterium]